MAGWPSPARKVRAQTASSASQRDTAAVYRSAARAARTDIRIRRRSLRNRRGRRGRLGKRDDAHQLAELVAFDHFLLEESLADDVERRAAVGENLSGRGFRDVDDALDLGVDDARGLLG